MEDSDSIVLNVITHSPASSGSSPSESTPNTPTSLREDLEDDEVVSKHCEPVKCSESQFRAFFESYVESNFGRGTRSQTITRETYENFKSVLAGESETSRRRVRLYDQGYRLGTATSPEVPVGYEASSHELVLWRLKSEGRGNNYMSTETRPRIVAPVEDFYDIITSMHHASPSASGQKKAFKMISKRYVGIPREVVIFYMRNCPHCAAASRRRAIVVGLDHSQQQQQQQQQQQPQPPPAKRMRPTDELLLDKDLGSDFGDSQLLEAVEQQHRDIALLLNDETDDQFDDDGLGANADAYKAFTTFVQLLADKNLNRILSLPEQPREKLEAIAAAAGRQFPEFGQRAEFHLQRYLKQCRRQRRKPMHPTSPVVLSAKARQRLLDACRGERAAMIRATADSAEAFFIKALTESDVAAAVSADVAPKVPGPAVATTQAHHANDAAGGHAANSAPAAGPGAADAGGAAASNLLLASGLNNLPADMNPSLALATLSSLPIQPTHLAGALRMVGVLLLMVANQMDSSNASSADTSTVNSSLNGDASHEQMRVNNLP